MTSQQTALPVSEAFSVEKAPGHWLLARLGKKVLRPGGIEATNTLLNRLAISSGDRVIEFAPGLGVTARRILKSNPANYTGIERDESAAQRLVSSLGRERVRIVQGSAESSGLDSATADVVLGEAMLTMQPTGKKREIIGEAARLLNPGGRYGIHEIAVGPDDISGKVRQEIRASMSKAIHHGVTAQTEAEWRELLEEAGFEELHIQRLPFHLLEPKRLLADEGILGAARFACNLVRMPEARRRVLTMRRIFRRYQNHLSAIVITARKK